MTPGEQQYLDRLKEEYMGLLHAIQTGVKFTMGLDAELRVPEDKRPTSPKHLRTGVNSALIHTSALAEILIAKGILTSERRWRTFVLQNQTPKCAPTLAGF